MIPLSLLFNYSSFELLKHWYELEIHSQLSCFLSYTSVFRKVKGHIKDFSRDFSGLSEWMKELNGFNWFFGYKNQFLSNEIYFSAWYFFFFFFYNHNDVQFNFKFNPVSSSLKNKLRILEMYVLWKNENVTPELACGSENIFLFLALWRRTRLSEVWNN